MAAWKQVWVILVRGPSGQWLPSGPYSDEELKMRVAQGELSLSTWVWRRGLARWAQLSELEVLSTGDSSWCYEARLRGPDEHQFAQLQWSDRLNPKTDPSIEEELGESLLDSDR